MRNVAVCEIRGVKKSVKLRLSWVRTPTDENTHRSLVHRKPIIHKRILVHFLNSVPANCPNGQINISQAIAIHFKSLSNSVSIQV